jgi:hypothetical protein
VIAALATLLRALTRLPVLVRIWWRSPDGIDRNVLDAARLPADAHFEHIARSSVGGISTSRWRHAIVFGGYGQGSFAIESEDERTREFLTEEIFGWRRHDQGRDLPTVITEFADRALLGLPCLVEVRFEEREGTTHFVGLDYLQPQYVRRRGGQYDITPPRESREPRVVEGLRMLDAERDVPLGLGATARGQVIDAYFDEKILDSANSATTEAQLPGRSGLRWDAARLRRIDRRRTYLLGARITHLLAGSLIERQLYYYNDKPPFTDFFLRWQLHDCLNRLRSVREAVLTLLDERVLRVLTDGHGLPAGHLTVVTVPSHEQEGEAYETAQRTSQQPFAYYRRATRVEQPPA